MPERVVVRVPATVANLGPGFDCLGLALAWHNQVTVEGAEQLEITAAGPGADRIARDETNLVARGLAAVCGELPAVRIHQMISIPFGRGFGSSAAAIVAGVVAGRALAASDHSDLDLVWIASDLEGHPDNAAPCLLGGVTVVAGRALVRLQPPPAWRVLVCVAPGRFATEAARAALPEQLSRADAVATSSRASLLSAALATGSADVLMTATEDVLHQPARFALMPDAADLVRALRAEGVAAFLSGAGPSVAAIVPGDASNAMDVARARVPDGWEVRSEAIEPSAATVVESR